MKTVKKFQIMHRKIYIYITQYVKLYLQQNFIISNLMNQTQILSNRVLNSIQNIKHKLKSTQNMTLFNDLLIIQYIVPQLQKQVLRDLLRQFHGMEKRVKAGDIQNITLVEINRILSMNKGNNEILQDFLQCAVQQLIVEGAH